MSLLLRTTWCPRQNPWHCHNPHTHHPTEEDRVPGSYLWWSASALPHRHNPWWLARGHRGCSMSSLPIPSPTWCPNIWGWPHPLLSSTCHPTHRKWESTPSNSWRPPRHDQVTSAMFDNMSTCLESIQTSMAQPKSVWHAKTIIHRSHKTTSANPSPRVPMATSWHWLLPLSWIQIPHFHWLLLQDADCLQNHCITIQCCKDKIYHEAIICRMWNSRISMHWQWPTICKCIFAPFVTDWKFDHNTSAAQNPRSNGQVEAAVKIVKGLPTFVKCSGLGAYLALLAYCSTPSGAHLCAPAKLLYQQTLCTTVPQCIQKPLVEDSTGMLRTTFVNATQMPAAQMHLSPVMYHPLHSYPCLQLQQQDLQHLQHWHQLCL